VCIIGAARNDGGNGPVDDTYIYIYIIGAARNDGGNGPVDEPKQFVAGS
jgi:hypothetical protein